MRRFPSRQTDNGKMVAYEPVLGALLFTVLFRIVSKLRCYAHRSRRAETGDSMFERCRMNCHCFRLPSVPV